MQYFIVSQNKTFKEEYSGSFLWAPQKSKNGQEIFHWNNMKIIEKGDIIFSIVKRNIIAVNIALTTYQEANNPFYSSEKELWNNNGWLVKVDYNILDNKINIDNYIEKILTISTGKYAPFTSTGNINQGYLFKINEELGNYLLNIINENNNMLEFISQEDKKIIEDTENFINNFNDETEKEIVVKTRIGQGKFKEKLLIRSTCCEICGLDIQELLIASHCKPWKKSNDKERLDINNGLLLCTLHDSLFDKGFITFDEDGKIIISNKIKEENYRLLNIDKDIKIKISESQVSYLKHHKKEEFKN